MLYTSSLNIKSHSNIFQEKLVLRIAEGLNSYAQRWKRFCYEEWPKKGENPAPVPADSKVTKRRVKPTLVTHIGLPNRSSQFAPSSKHLDDPFLSREIKPISKVDSFVGRHLEGKINLASNQMTFPTVRVLPENERRVASLAIWLIKQKRGYQGYLSLCELLFLHLRTLHQIYSTPDAKDQATPGMAFLNAQLEPFSDPITSVDVIFSDIFMPIYFGIEVLKGLFTKICKLTPSFIPYLETNSCAKKICPKLFQKAVDKITRSSLTGRCSIPRDHAEAPSSDPLIKDVFDAIAYADKRDSRNFSEQPYLHSNQQKVRDMFLDFIRFAGSDFMPKTGLMGSRSDVSKEIAGRVGEIMRTLAPENVHWFADLLIFQFDQMRKRMDAAIVPVNSAKLELLEERLTKSSDGQAHLIETSSVVQFIKLADSHRLHCNLLLSLNSQIREIEKGLLEGRRSNFLDSTKRLAHLNKLVAYLKSGEHNLEDLHDGIRKSIEDVCFLLKLPQVIAYLQVCDSADVTNAIWSQLCSYAASLEETGSDLSRKDLVASQLINYHAPKIECDRALNPFYVSTVKRAADFSKLSLVDPIDFDPSIEMEQMLIPDCPQFTALLNILKSAKKGDSLPSPPRIGPVASAEPVSQSETPSCSFKYSRKIRPITLDTAVKPNLPVPTSVPQSDAENIQKKLRHWYWWQWPDLKDILDHLVRYSVAESSKRPTLTSKEERLDHLKILLRQSIPPLLPCVLQANESSIDLAVALALEKAVDFLQ